MGSDRTERVRVGIAGLGRSGWDIHCRLLEPLAEKYQIVAVFDRLEDRRKEAADRFGCATYDSFDRLAGDENVELVIVAMPSHLHAKCSIEALEAGRDVVCEKPMAASLAEADEMLAARDRTGRLLTIFQNRRYEPVFCKVREITESGILGRIVEIKSSMHGFARRWDWQTLQKYGGGTLRNTGPHVLDQVLTLLGDDTPEVFCHLECAVTSGDAEDHVKILLKAPNGPLADIEITSVCAYAQERWLVMGTRGTLRSDGSGLVWQYFDPAGMPERPVDEQPTADRSYNREEIPWQEDRWEAPEGTSWNLFYDDLYRALREGAPLVIRPEQVRLQMAVIDECLRQSLPERKFD